MKEVNTTTFTIDEVRQALVHFVQRLREQGIPDKTFRPVISVGGPASDPFVPRLIFGFHQGRETLNDFNNSFKETSK